MLDYIGYLASILVLCTFCAKTMLPLRTIALGSNVAFISYGALLHLYPVLLLHVILLPLNAWRLAEILLLGKRAQKLAGADAIFTALSPFATRTIARRGEVIIRRGDPSECLYLVYEGLLLVDEAGAERGSGSVIGEMGVLSRTQVRTATVRAHTDCVLGRVSKHDFDRIYFTNPSLGLEVIRLIIDRLNEEIETRRVTGIAAAARPALEKSGSC
ncbi:MAG: cyclic nucleotide-binding domain-containing protein [Alphaproteobacteria bacterium]|nr:cyclic nucleotide-binding domain-containing protein [Alphaproteobacteria bacterium]